MNRWDSMFFYVVGVIILIALLIRILSPRKRIEPHPTIIHRKRWSAEYQGVKYCVEQYSADITTIEIKLPRKITSRLEVNARTEIPDTQSDSRHAEIKALLEDCATYIDIGYNTSRVAAEFPITMNIEEPFAHKILNRLIRRRDASY